MKGRLVELLDDEAYLRKVCEGCVKVLEASLSAYAIVDIAALDDAMIKVQSSELSKHLSKLRETRESIRKIKVELGEA
jgi:hypothetical protein